MKQQVSLVGTRRTRRAALTMSVLEVPAQPVDARQALMTLSGHQRPRFIIAQRATPRVI
jgi:hypothetical protein